MTGNISNFTHCCYIDIKVFGGGGSGGDQNNSVPVNIDISVHLLTNPSPIGHGLRVQKVTFRSNILGTTFSLWFYIA